VRDVATAHLLVMTARAAVGRRFLLSNGAAFPGKDIGDTLRRRIGDASAPLRLGLARVVCEQGDLNPVVEVELL
jgi:nucleoside-diphosphate-sugar epimerase